MIHSLGPTFFSFDIARGDSLVRDSTAPAHSVRDSHSDGDSTARSSSRSAAGASRPVYEPERLDVGIRLPKDRPVGTVVLRGARIISMRGSEVIASGDVVDRDNRIAGGGRVGMGTHGQFQGLGAQWEIWNIASGGMPRHDVLRVATIYGAEAIGLGKQLGSIEPGKLADLQVLDANPLDDIRNTNSVRLVMKNGRRYEAATMDEAWPRQRPAPPMWWRSGERSVTSAAQP